MHLPIPPKDETIESIKNNPEKYYDFICDLTNMINKLMDKFEILERENAELKRRLNINSRNSSQPPSKDQFKSKKNLRAKTNRKVGGQAGHEGKTLLMVKNPDHKIFHERKTCENCDHDLSEATILKSYKRQVFDLPELPKVEVTEYTSHSKVCPCCAHKNSPLFPPNVNNNTQYGTNVEKLIIYFHDYQLIPFERVTQIFDELFGIQISSGTIQNTTREISSILEEDNVKTLLEVQTKGIINADDTPVSVNGKSHYIYTFSHETVSYLYPHPTRSKQALEDSGIFNSFKGTLVHDFYSTYFMYNGIHSSCNVHILRELKYVSEEMNQNWSKMMASLLCEAKSYREELKKIGTISFNESNIKYYEDKYEEIIKSAYIENIEDSKKRFRSKAINLYLRLDKHRKIILRYIYDFEVPFDNNLAERELRMSKLKMKISGCFKNFASLQNFCKIRNYISNSRKKGLSVLDSIGFLLRPSF